LPQPDPPKRFGSGTSGDYLRDPLQMGFQIVGVTAVFGGVGWWLDKLLHTFPFLMAFGAALGLFGIIYLTYLRLRASDKDDSKSESDDHPPRTGGK
jgi:F0F1-type ATP synthase assembly protein I